MGEVGVLTMRIYLMAVGKQDPFTMKREDGVSLDFPKILKEYGSDWVSRQLPLDDGPILSFLQRQPVASKDWVVLISTQGEPPVVDSPTFQGGEATKAELCKRYNLPEDHVLHESIKDVDPSNFGAIATPMRELVRSLLQKIQDQIEPKETEIECIVNVSPGTPQMQAVWYLMAHAGQLKATLLQTKQWTNTIEQVSISPLAAEQFIELGMRFFQDYSFNAAAEAFKRAASVLETYEPKRAHCATLARDIADAYHDWSIFQHQAAVAKLNQLLATEGALPSDLKTTLDLQIKFLTKLTEPIPKYRAINAYHTAKLEYDRHDTVESIWRAGAAYEQALLERALQIAEQRSGFRPDPFDFKKSISEKLADRTLLPEERQRLQEFRNECRAMNIWQDYLSISSVKPVLERWDREFTRDSFWEKAEMDIAWVRNNAVHRAEPVSAKQAKEALKILRKAMERTFADGISEELDSCPFSSQRLHSVKEHLAALLKG